MWLARLRIAVLGRAVSAGYWPGLLSGGFVPCCAAMAVGIPLCSAIGPRALPEAMRYGLAFVIALPSISLMVSPGPMPGTLGLAVRSPVRSSGGERAGADLCLWRRQDDVRRSSACLMVRNAFGGDTAWERFGVVPCGASGGAVCPQ